MVIKNLFVVLLTVLFLQTLKVLFFSNHPKNVLAKKTVVKNILYWDEKYEILKNLVDYLVSIPFDEEIQTMEPSAYKRITSKITPHERSLLWFNYRFGYKGEGI